MQQRGGNRDQHDCNERLEQRGRKGQHHAAAPGLFVRDQIGRDHSLAVTGPGGVKDAVEKRQREQAPRGSAVGLGGADQARELPVELGLLGKDPAEHAADRNRGSLRARHTERAPLREGRVRETGDEEKSSHEHDGECTAVQHDGCAAAGLAANSLHGHFTMALLANSEPMVSVGSL